MTRVAIVQMNPRLGDVQANLAAVERLTRDAASQGAKMVVFPECALTGYMYESLDEAMTVAEPIPGRASHRLARLAQEHGIYVVAGLLEQEDTRCFNTAVLAGPDGFCASYRKTHTLCLGVDRFTTPGNIPYTVHDLAVGRVGILICYDLRFPEPARVLGLQGAQMVVLPTNWPETSAIQPDVFTRARAAENRVYLLAANRVGTEREATFLGRSQIVGPSGTPIQEASTDNVEMLIDTIDPAEADRKRVVIRDGVHEMDCMADRRPELYAGVGQSFDVAVAVPGSRDGHRHP